MSFSSRTVAMPGSLTKTAPKTDHARRTHAPARYLLVPDGCLPQEKHSIHRFFKKASKDSASCIARCIHPSLT
jgi:hypothetical protein